MLSSSAARRFAFSIVIALAVGAGALAGSGAVAKAADGPDPAVAPLIERVVAAAGGADKLLELFRVREQLNVSSDPHKPASERVSIIEPPHHWWLGSRDRMRAANPEPATFLVWGWTLGALTDPESQIEAISEVPAPLTQAFGLRVGGTIDPPMDLYFDQASNRLLEIHWRSDIHRFSDWREVDGAAYAAHSVGYRKATGKPWYFSQLLEVERLEELPAGLSR